MMLKGWFYGGMDGGSLGRGIDGGNLGRGKERLVEWFILG